ncbi:MAG: pyridoxamine 5'-phosphate oxidase family protein [Candidatus Krumholzibacteriota bacterium]|nr:pyridoxamine 5'-phosphate oxidase family protein [Candidatus Krumholzibacteriota bacterium]
MKNKYHLKRTDREIKDKDTIEQLLAGCRLAFISVCKVGEPYIVTMNYGYDSDRRALYFHCALKGHKLDIIRENSSACAFIFRDHGYVDGKCEHKYQSLIVRGDISIVESFDEKKHGIDILMDHQESDPEPVRKRNFKKETDYDIFNMLRLDIEDITAKESL